MFTVTVVDPATSETIKYCHITVTNLKNVPPCADIICGTPVLHFSSSLFPVHDRQTDRGTDGQTGKTCHVAY